MISDQAPENVYPKQAITDTLTRLLCLLLLYTWSTPRQEKSGTSHPLRFILHTSQIA